MMSSPLPTSLPGSIVAIVMVVLSAAPALAQTTQPATRPSSIAGKVSAAGGKALPEMIVYLESADPAAKFPPPAEVIHVSQRDARFSPAVIVVTVGQSVDF